MKAITFFNNAENDHRIVQIDIDQIAGKDDLVEDMFDLLTIELRRNERTISWEEVKKQIR